MDPHSFINMAFQFAALNNFAERVEQHTLCFDNPEDLVAVGEDGIGHDFPADGILAYEDALEAEQRPLVSYMPDMGWFVTHGFGDEDAEPVRMICWAEIGPDKLNEVACAWWKEQGADPDGIVPGVTDLHRGGEE